MAAFGQQPSLEQLRQNVAELEARWNDYPTLRSTVAPDLRAARLALVARLQKDLAYFASKNAGPDKSTKQLLDQIAREITQQNTKLVSEATGSDGGNGKGMPPEALPKPDETKPKQTATQPKTNLEQKPVQQSVDTKPHVDQTTAVQPGQITEANAGTSKLDPKAIPNGFKYTIDISRDFKTGNANSNCSNRAFGQEAAVWMVKVMLSPLTQDGRPALQSADTIFQDSSGRTFNVLVFSAKQQGETTTLLTGDKSTYVGHLKNYARSVQLVFENKTLAEATDIVNLLAAHPDKIQVALSPKTVDLEIYQFSYVSNDPQVITKDNFYNALKKHIDASDLRNSLKSITAKGEFKLPVDPLGEVTFQTAYLSPADTPELNNLLKKVEIDPTTLAAAQANLKQLIDHGLLFESSDPKFSAEMARKDPANADTNGQDENAKQLIVVDNPCYQFSVAPLANGSSGLQPAASFKLRYDYYSPGNALVFRLRGEGEGADSTKYFQRIKVSGEPTVFLVKDKGGWQVVGGGLGTYSFTRPNGNLVSEWRAGGKLEIKTPVLFMFNQLAGSNSKPTFNLEAAAAGGDATTTRTTDFDIRARFVYTLRASTKMSLDFTAAAGASNTARFAKSKNFSFLDFGGRYNFSSDWDYIVRYQCGKQDPDYKKFCGWQTGFALVTGR